MDYKQRIIDSGAIMEGHFVYTSGKHGSVYVQKRILGRQPQLVLELSPPIADHFAEMNPEVVIAPAYGAIPFGFGVTLELNKRGCDTICLIAEKDEPGQLKLNPADAKLCTGKRVLIIDDITTTGKSGNQAIDLVKRHEGQPIGIGLIWNRGEVLFDGLNQFSLVTETYPAYEQADCPLCKDFVPVNTDAGHGADYVQVHGQPQAS